MKIVKKMLSAICAMSMIATAASAMFTSVHADNTVKIVVTQKGDYDDTNGATLKVSMVGLKDALKNEIPANCDFASYCDMYAIDVSIGLSLKDVDWSSLYTVNNKTGAATAKGITIDQKLTGVSNASTSKGINLKDADGKTVKHKDGTAVVANMVAGFSVDFADAEVPNENNGFDLNNIDVMEISGVKLNSGKNSTYAIGTAGSVATKVYTSEDYSRSIDGDFIFPATIDFSSGLIGKADETHNVNVTPNDDYTITATPATAKKGEEVKLAIDVKKAGYELDYFTVDDTRIEGNTFTMPDADVTVAAVLKETVVVDDGTADRVVDKNGENHWNDGDNDHSVAFSKVFTNTAAKTYTLEAVVGGTTYTHPKEIEIPNVDANVEYKVGIIIQYNPNAGEGAIDFSNITSLKFVEK